MAKLKKYLSGYRRPSLAFTMPEEELRRHDRDYLVWLAEQRGWIAITKSCPQCYGRKLAYDPAVTFDESRYYRRNQNAARKRWEKRRVKAGKPAYLTDADLIVCPECDGTGKVALDEPEIDLERASGYIEQQRHDLETIAEKSVVSVKHRLFWHDFRQVIYGSRDQAPQSVAEYDAQAAEADAARRVFDDACHAAQEARERFEEEFRNATSEEQLALLNNYDTPRPYTELDRRRDALRDELCRFGSVLENRWYRPGSTETIHVGTRGARRYHNSIPPTVSIVIKPGRAPSEAELDAIVAEAIAELTANQPQLLAA